MHTYLFSVLPVHIMRQMVGMKFVEYEEVPTVNLKENISLPSTPKSLLSEANPSYLRFIVFTDDISKEEQEIREKKNRTKQLVR